MQGIDLNDFAVVEELASTFEREARKGDSDALYAMGHIHYNGIGVKADIEKAIGFWKESIETGGHPEALYNIALAHHDGVEVDGKIIVEKNFPRSLKLFEKLAEQGHADAHFMTALINIYEYEGVQKNPKKGLWHLDKAIELMEIPDEAISEIRSEAKKGVASEPAQKTPNALSINALHPYKNRVDE